MKRITALPVRGESFLLEHLGKKILVDGGHSSSKLGPALKKQLGTKSVHLDIVICTHSDKDHAGGLVDLLDVEGISVTEFWLPGSWSNVVNELVEQPDQFYDGLVSELRESDDRIAARLSGEDNERIDLILKSIGRHARSFDQSKEARIGREGTKLILRPRDANESRLAAVAAKMSISRLHKPRRIRTKARKLVDTAERIREIAASANEHNVDVRWFDYLEYSKHRIASGGDVGFLEPLNAQELVIPPSLKLKMYRRFVALSIANRESLVFLSSANDAHVGVLFCGDSPLGDGRRYEWSFLEGKKWSGPLIATAPHHGADSNKMAYDHIAEFGDVAFWIRAGGHSHHPETAFQRLPPERRTCTHCPHNLHPLRSVVITDKYQEFTDPQAWLVVRSHDCTCSDIS